MLAYTAYFHPQQFKRIMRALIRLEQFAEQVEEDLPRRQAVEYTQLLQRNIWGQKHMAGYPAYHPRYAEWKSEYAPFSGYWQAFGHIVNAMRFWKVGKGQWAAGIPATTMYPYGTSWFGPPGGARKRPISMAQIARIMEYGHYIHPERPIFGPTKEEYQREGFTLRGEEALKQIAKRWS